MTPKKRIYPVFLDGIPENVVVLKREGDTQEYHKTVPQTSFEMLGMGVREDFTKAHCYIYENGKEVEKDKLNWWIPDDCLYRGTASPSQPLILTLPSSTSTFSCGTIASSTVTIDIDREGEKVIVTPDKETPIAFVAFKGEYHKWEPVTTASYVDSSSG